MDEIKEMMDKMTGIKTDYVTSRCLFYYFFLRNHRKSKRNLILRHRPST